MIKKLIAKLSKPDGCVTHPDGSTWITAELTAWQWDDNIWTTTITIVQEIKQNRFGKWERLEHWKRYKDMSDYFKEFEL